MFPAAFELTTLLEAASLDRNRESLEVGLGEFVRCRKLSLLSGKSLWLYDTATRQE
ncbi:hypothetical protein HispidOSU_015921 [Sigmodon hispidus]